MQTYTSANTSINKNRVPSIYNIKDAQAVMEGKKVIDIGGGKFDNAIYHALEKFNAYVSIYDKYNRTAEHNHKVLCSCYNVAVISNVLNVIDNHTARMEVIRLALRHSKVVLITVYEGDKTGNSRPSGADQWQEHRSTQSYVKEIKAEFPHLEVIRKGKLITIK